MARFPEIEQLADSAIEKLRGDLNRLVNKIATYLAGELTGLDTDKEGRIQKTNRNAEMAARLGQEFAGILGDLGYDRTIADLVDAFSQLEELSRAVGDAAVGGEYQGASVPSLVAFVNGTVDDLIAIKGAVAERLREVLLVGINTNLPLTREIAALAEAAGGPLSEAATLADTSLMGFHRDILVSQAEEAGVDLFQYLGPDDAVIRPFCGEHVGKVYTTEDLDDEDNDQGLEPTSRYLGGLNCRHYLAPIMLDEARSLPSALIAGPRAYAIVSGNHIGPAEYAFTSANLGRVVNGGVVRRRAA